jgi:hypothetical protein
LEPCAAREERLSFSDGLLVACLCLVVSFGAMASLPRAQDGSVPAAIVFPPWVGAAEAISLSLATGHRVLRSGRLPSIVVVAPAGPANAAALPHGAWFSLVLTGLAGCLDAAAAVEASR